MKLVKPFSKEIIQVGGILIALPTIISIGEVFVKGHRGHGDVHYAFAIKCMMSADPIYIYSEEIPYWNLDLKNESFWGHPEDSETYINVKIEALTLRDEVVALWAAYLESKDISYDKPREV